MKRLHRHLPCAAVTTRLAGALSAEAEEYADKGEAGQAGSHQQYAGDPVGKGEGQYHAPGGWYLCKVASCTNSPLPEEEVR